MKRVNIKLRNKSNNKNIGIAILNNDTPPFNIYKSNINILSENISSIDLYVKENSTNLSFVLKGSCKINAYNGNIYNMVSGITPEYNFPNGFYFSQDAMASNVEYINYLEFYNGELTYMGSMFAGCSSLKELNLSNINTSNVKSMENLTYYCSSLQSLDLSSFNTYNLNNTSGMFLGCSSLEYLDLSNFDPKNIINMSNMFTGCDSLKNIKCNSKFYDWLLLNKNNCGCSNNMITKCEYNILDKNIIKIGLQ